MSYIKDNKPEESSTELKEDITDTKKEIKDMKYVIIGISIMLIVLILIFVLPQFTFKEKPKTISDLLQETYEKNKNTDTAYVYNGYSFVFIDGLWYTQIRNQYTQQMYNIPLHFGPKELENVTFVGDLNQWVARTKYNNISKYVNQAYMTFDATGGELGYIALATTELAVNILHTYDMMLIASCIKNETEACSLPNVSIVTCNSTTEPVVYFQVSNESGVFIEGNCLTIKGKNFEIVRGADRLLLDLYGVMN